MAEMLATVTMGSMAADLAGSIAVVAAGLGATGAGSESCDAGTIPPEFSGCFRDMATIVRVTATAHAAAATTNQPRFGAARNGGIASLGDTPDPKCDGDALTVCAGAADDDSMGRVSA